jgi:hypothetical protein
MAKKSTCPVNRSEFREKAQPVKVIIGENEYQAEVKEFSTGSLGWNINSKATIEVGGKRVPVQVGLNLTVIGSKDLPQEE